MAHGARARQPKSRPAKDLGGTAVHFERRRDKPVTPRYRVL